jgi:hypothetical protein
MSIYLILIYNIYIIYKYSIRLRIFENTKKYQSTKYQSTILGVFV